MFRTRFTIGLAVVALLGVSACSSDSGAKKIESAASDTTLAGDSSSGATLPLGSIPGLSADCQKMYQQLIGALGAAGTGTDTDLSKMFDALASSLPDDLKDDAKVMGAAFAKYSEVLKKYNNDIAKVLADPEAAKIMEGLNSPEVTKASDNITAYFDATCPQN
jgi:hypothetical protein